MEQKKVYLLRTSAIHIDPRLHRIVISGRQDVWEYDPVLFNGTQAEYEANRVENVARANADHNQVDDTWERVKEVGLRGLTSKRHMKIVLRWMRERQKIRLICKVVGPHKQFLYTTWFSKPSISHTRAVHNSSTSTPSFSVDTSSPKLSSGCSTLVLAAIPSIAGHVLFFATV